jgi:hypothetical protein
METLAVIVDRFGSDQSDVQGAAQSSIGERGSGQAIRRGGEPMDGRGHEARLEGPFSVRQALTFRSSDTAPMRGRLWALAE